MMLNKYFKRQTNESQTHMIILNTYTDYPNHSRNKFLFKLFFHTNILR